MEALLFLGCTVPVRNLNYELSARKVAAALGVELRDMAGLGCCGYPLKAFDQDTALVLAARALAQAGESGLTVVPLCSSCAGTLNEAAHHLDHDPQVLALVQERLTPLGLTYRPGVRVRHLARYLLEEVGLEAIAAKVTRPLSEFTFAPHYGCHLLKPSRVMEGFDDPEAPTSLARLIAVTGAKSLDYRYLKECCGGGVLGADEDLAGRMAGHKLLELSAAAVTAMVVICPFCNVMYEGQQKAIAKKLGADIKVPVVYLTQILGLAMGMSPDELGFKLNRVKPKELLAAFK
jgi:heterodisulfide reductase subunit B